MRGLERHRSQDRQDQRLPTTAKPRQTASGRSSPESGCLSARPHRAGHAVAGLGPRPSLPLPLRPTSTCGPQAVPHPCCLTGPFLLLFSFCLSFKPALRHCSVVLGAKMCLQKGPERPVLFHGTWTSRDCCGAHEENTSSLGYRALPQSEALHHSRLSHPVTVWETTATSAPITLAKSSGSEQLPRSQGWLQLPPVLFAFEILNF